MINALSDPDLGRELKRIVCSTVCHFHSLPVSGRQVPSKKKKKMNCPSTCKGCDFCGTRNKIEKKSHDYYRFTFK